jgi:hypothetical protein
VSENSERLQRMMSAIESSDRGALRAAVEALTHA